jgi:hypothetical protein
MASVFKMDRSIVDFLKPVQTRRTGTESKCGQMEANTKDSGSMIRQKDMEDSFWPMEMSTRVNGTTIRLTVSAITITQREQLTKEGGLKISRKVKAEKIGLMAATTRECI